MTSYPHQFLYLGDSVGCPHEVVNGGRAAYNLTVAGLATGRFSNVLDDMGCEALAYTPMCVTNLLTREGSTFETGITPWAAYANCSVSASTAAARSGTGSMRMRSTAGGDMSASTPSGTSGMPVVEGVSYTARGWFRAATTGRQCFFYVEWYDSGGAYVTEDFSGGITSTTTGWTEDKITATAPAGAAYAAVVAWVDSTGAANEDHYIDDCGLMVAQSSLLDQLLVPGVDGNDASIGWGQWLVHDSVDPWDNGADAASEAFGLIIEEWTGIDGGHHTRSATPVGVNRGGARFGPQSSKARVMKINALLLGSSERGLAHLFRWLERELLDPGEACANRSLWFRDVCPEISVDPTNAELEVGWFRMDRVVLVEGPTWESEPAKGGGCYIRRVSFTLTAGDPCMYSAGSYVHEVDVDATGATYNAALGEAVCDAFEGTLQVFVEVTPGDVGNGAPRVTISSAAEYDGPDRLSLPNFRIFGIASPDVGTADPCVADKLGELVLAPFMATGTEIVVDFAARQVLYRDPVSGGDWMDGSRFLVPGSPGGTRRWWDFGANTGVIYIEPLYAGLKNSLSGLAETLTTNPSWTVRVESVQRIGCA